MGDLVLGLDYVVAGSPVKRYCDLSQPRNTWQWSLLGSVELPSGEDQAQMKISRIVRKPLPPHLQLGLGSQNQAVGTVVAWNRGRWIFSADAFYKRYGTARDFRPGNFLGAQIAVDYLVVPSLLFDAQFRLGTGLQGASVGRAQQAGTTVKDSGGRILFLVPTAQLFFNRHLALDLRVSVPLVADFRSGEVSLPVVTQLGLRTFFRVENNRLTW